MRWVRNWKSHIFEKRDDVLIFSTELSKFLIYTVCWIVSTSFSSRKNMRTVVFPSPQKRDPKRRYWIWIYHWNPLDMVDIFWDPRSLGHSARSAQRWSLCFWTCCAQWPVVLRIYGQEFILRHHQFDFFSQFDVQKSTIKNCHFAIELVHISMGFHEKTILAYEVQDGAHQL